QNHRRLRAPSPTCREDACSCPSWSSSRIPVCLHGSEIESRSHVQNFGQENARYRPGSPFGLAPSLQSTRFALPPENVRSPIFRRRKSEQLDSRARNAHKLRASASSLPTSRLQFREQSALPARETRTCAATGVNEYP